MNNQRRTVLVLVTIAAIGAAVIAGFAVYRVYYVPPLNKQESLDKQLIDAIHDDSTDSIQRSLKAGANPDARGYWDPDGARYWYRLHPVWDPRRNSGGPTALMLTMLSGSINATKILVRNGADVNARDVEGNSALMYAGMYGRTVASRLLLDHGADVKPSKHGEDPLGDAVSIGDKALVLRLITRGARVNDRNANGNAPLHGAAQGCDASMLQLLLDHGVDPNALNHDHDSPLHLVIGSGVLSGHGIRIPAEKRMASIRVLLKHRVALHVLDGQGRTPLQVGKERGFSEVAGLLVSAGAKK